MYHDIEEVFRVVSLILIGHFSSERQKEFELTAGKGTAICFFRV